MARRPPDFEERLWPASPSASTACGNRIALPMDAALGVKALLLGLVPEGGEIGRDRNAGDDLDIALLEGVDLGEKSSVRFW
jgi:hypothetical protein